MGTLRAPVPSTAENLTPADARAVLLGAAALGRPLGEGAPGVHTLLDRLGAIQLDPIDRVGTNADLVASARVDGLSRGDVHAYSQGRAFEHFAKERCLLHARYFPHYRARAVETPWWRSSERAKRVPASVLDEVLAEVRERGPIAAQALTGRGKTEAIDWSGWKSTSSLSAMAAELLWTRCELVVSGRDERGRRLYADPTILGDWATRAPDGEFESEMLLDRVRMCGLLARAGGPMWSMLHAARTDGTVERLLEEGRLVQVRVGRRPYLVLPDPQTPPPDDGRTRILGPLDPLLWDRALVRDAFGFDYVWEIYKPEPERTWGYYVCPVLQDGALVARLEGRRDGRALVVERLWGTPDYTRLQAALERLAACNGCTSVATIPRPLPAPEGTRPASAGRPARKDTSRPASR